MPTKINNTMRFDLTDSKSMEKVIKMLDASDIPITVSEKFIDRVLDEGVKIAQQESPVDTGKLRNSIHSERDNKFKGRIVCDCEYGAYVEFGVGVKGEGTYPESIEWQYDINNHGEDGWYYRDDNHVLHHTTGNKANPFMLRTSQKLENLFEKIAKELIKK